jgi:hypothetical protein
MEEYIKWLENKIEVCLEDKDLQREHWAFCQALKKYRELALRQPPVIGSVCTCRNAELENDSLVPVYCHNCNAYVQTDI